MHLRLHTGKPVWHQQIFVFYFDSIIMNKPDLTIPHPAIAERMFVLAPMNELAPGLIHPVLLKSISEMVNNCADILNVSKM